MSDSMLTRLPSLIKNLRDAHPSPLLYNTNKKPPLGGLVCSLEIVTQSLNGLHLLESCRPKIPLHHHGMKRTNQTAFEKCRILVLLPGVWRSNVIWLYLFPIRMN